MTKSLSIVPPPLPDSNPSGEEVNHPIVTPRRLAPHVMVALLDAQLAGRRCSLDDLAEKFPVRRSDLRRTLTALHGNDLVDALRCRLTLKGFALALNLREAAARPLREALRGDGRPKGKVITVFHPGLKTRMAV